MLQGGVFIFLLELFNKLPGSDTTQIDMTHHTDTNQSFSAIFMRL